MDKDQRLQWFWPAGSGLSSAAADAKQATSNPTPASASNGQTAASNASGSASSGSSGSGTSGAPSKKVGITIITVEAEGEGGNLKQATNEAIRSAIAQVLGEKFASSQLSTILLPQLKSVTQKASLQGSQWKPALNMRFRQAR